ncbi:MAG: dTDP-glucose 4,6-dehydratase [Bacteroidia bacterium]|nr:dTDP-glucose 4,6-dehydratase [Bacteroidia bacterium]
MKTILITGGAGFIGSHLVRRFVNNYPNYRILNVDKLTYAGNLANLQDIENAPNYVFSKADICDAQAIEALFEQYDVSSVIHLAAESHVDRSIHDPMAFVNTNVIGTVTLLNVAKKYWAGKNDVRFYHVSTDEVYGSLGDSGFFYETTPYDPNSPYSASKASSDHFVRAYAHTYKLPIVISNCSNNYGPYQFPEKLIPLMIANIINRKPLPVYGKGENVRDWLWVEDHCSAIDAIFHQGKNGETFNIGGENEWKNIDLVQYLCKIMDEQLGRKPGESAQLISFISDRPGHDLRYAINCDKVKKELGWKQSLTFETGLVKTVEWYIQNTEWVNQVLSGEYQNYYTKQYQNR